jgi:YaiO family outer membrane protein
MPRPHDLCAALVLLSATPALAQEADAGRTALPSRVGIEYGYVSFDDDATDPWHQVTLELSRRGSVGTLVGRVNWAERFEQTGVQVEVDAYPRLSRKAYLYANLGVSGDEIFPETRVGGELFLSLPRSMEASFGARQLWFADTDVTLLTGSIGKYAGNYYFSLRPYVTPREEDSGYSGSLLVRRYFASPESHVSLVMGSGSTPSEAPLEFELDRLTSSRVTLYGRHPLGARLGIRWSGGWEREELAAGSERNRLSVGAGLEARF